MTVIRSLIACAVLAASSIAVQAADSVPETKDSLSSARDLIAAKRWNEAVTELKRVNASGNADWNNLMGYSLRKQGTPDLAASERYYNEALRIDPKHKGTLEYSGELYLMKGDLPMAEQRLAALDKACTFSCSEYRELKKAIERYKSNGNKYVAGDY